MERRTTAIASKRKRYLSDAYAWQTATFQTQIIAYNQSIYSLVGIQDMLNTYEGIDTGSHTKPHAHPRVDHCHRTPSSSSKSSSSSISSTTYTMLPGMPIFMLPWMPMLVLREAASPARCRLRLWSLSKSIVLPRPDEGRVTSGVL